MEMMIRPAGMSALALACFMIAVPGISAAQSNLDQIEQLNKTIAAADSSSQTPKETPKQPLIPTSPTGATGGSRNLTAYAPPRTASQPPAVPQIPSSVSSRNYQPPTVPAGAPRQAYIPPSVPRVVEVPGEGEGAGNLNEGAYEASPVVSSQDLKKAAKAKAAKAKIAKAESNDAVEKTLPVKTEKKKPARKFWNWFSKEN